MAAYRASSLLIINKISKARVLSLGERQFHATAILSRTQAGKYMATKNKDKPLTYEQSFPPWYIGHTKSWLSWNTSTVEGGLRRPQTAIEDMFIRKFMVGTFPTAVLSEVIIKRQHNIIRISAIISAKILPRRACFLIGYTEELLSHWLQCIVKLEPIFENEHQKMIFKYI